MRRLSGLCILLWAAMVWGGEDQHLHKASLALLWSPQAQFAGYYVALDRGLYRREGIDMEIIRGGPGRSAKDLLRDGKVEFALLWLSTALEQREAGVPLVNIGQVIQRCSMLLVAKRSSGIRTPNDLNGRKVSLWGGDFAIPPRIFFRRYGIQVHEVPQTYSVQLFLRGGVAAASAMRYNEYHSILDSGLDPEELTLFALEDHGIDLPEDGLYTLSSTLERDPALVDAFVRATLAGWEYAFAHPEEALDIVIRHMRETGLPANRLHQRWMLEQMRGLSRPAAGGRFGRLDPRSYAAAGRALQEQGVVRSVPEYVGFTGGAECCAIGGSASSWSCSSPSPAL